MDTLFQILISNAVIAAIPALLAMIVARWVKRPALTHALWLLALLKLVTPPVIDVPVRVLPAKAVASAPAVVESAKVGSFDAPANWETGSTDVVASQAVPSASRGLSGDVPRASNAAAHSWRVSWALVTGCAWGAGAAFVLALTVWRLWRFNRLLRLAEPASRIVQAQADQVAQHLGVRRCPAVVVAPGALSPMLWAIGTRAKLVLPDELWGRLDAAQRAALLAHELAHFRRRDHWVRYLELAVAVLYWWHPLVWVSRRELRAAEEQCCDAWVVDALPGHERAYATALLDTVDFIAEGPAGGAVPLAASGAVGATDLKRRLVMIMNAANPKSLSSLGRIAVLGLGLVLLPAIPKLASADDAPKPREATRDGAKPREGARDGDRPREAARDPDRPRVGEREADRPLEGSTDAPRPREGADRPREGGDRLTPPVTLDTSGTGTFVRFERGVALLSDDANDKDVRIGITDGTKVTIDGRPSTLRELRPGIVVKASTADGVTTLEATRPRWMKAATPAVTDRDALRRREAAEPDRARVDVARPRGDGERPRDGEAPKVDDRPRDPARRELDRPRGDGAPRKEGDPNNPNAAPAKAVNPIRGVLERVDGTSLVISAGDRGGGSRVIPTDEQTKVIVDGQPAKLADVQPGMYVQVKQVDGLTTDVLARSRDRGR